MARLKQRPRQATNIEALPKLYALWCLDETYIKVKGKWKYLYRAVDKNGQTIDFSLTAKRDKNAARRFLHKMIKNFGTPEKINIDKSGANKAAIEIYNEVSGSNIVIRQNKYVNNKVGSLHSLVKPENDKLPAFWSCAQSKNINVDNSIFSRFFPKSY